MNAMLGKSSIGCFVAYWICVSFRIISDDGRFKRFVVETNVALFLLLVCGFVLSIIGIKRKESPKAYCVTSFVLHMIWLSLSLAVLREVLS